MDSGAPDPSANGTLRDARAVRELGRGGHTVAAVCLGVIFVAGFVCNVAVLLVFARFQSLWTPINLILLNIVVSDVLVCVFGTPFSFAASVYGRWLIGTHGCRWYGFANSLFGIVSLVSFAILSFERYCTILCYSKADISDYRKAWLSIACCWLYSLFWTLPPLFGWSSYGPEGPGTTCSVQWHQHSPGNVSYVICLFIFCLLLPLLLMVFCYSKILIAIRGAAKINQTTAQRRETHVMLMVVSMVACYLLCWMPYGIVALIAMFGRAGLIGPTASIIPSILAKSSTVLNPIIYVLFNNQFYRCFMTLIRCGSDPQDHHSLHTLQSSPAAAAAAHQPEDPQEVNATPPGSPGLSDHCDGESAAPQGGNVEKDKQSLVLVVHYSP
ncbi:teleost multiple tissue opsin 3b [Denticeps clupeoides]|uniref:teleost multiple tissue opsin 3b n=1 Tax=Denticeps clupeoides TaxID=299321 RepID=UPI0010A41354|nr:pinopsin-like [Denticeps clupeoides]